MCPGELVEPAVRTLPCSHRFCVGCGAFLPFKRARAIVCKLKLGSRTEWQEWSKSGERPNNNPSTPYSAYREAGWISTPDYSWGTMDATSPPSCWLLR